MENDFWKDSQKKSSLPKILLLVGLIGVLFVGILYFLDNKFPAFDPKSLNLLNKSSTPSIKGENDNKYLEERLKAIEEKQDKERIQAEQEALQKKQEKQKTIQDIDLVISEYEKTLAMCQTELAKYEHYCDDKEGMSLEFCLKEVNVYITTWGGQIKNINNKIESLRLTQLQILNQ